MTDEDLARPLPLRRNPFHPDSLQEMLATLGFHEAYHVGQFGLSTLRPRGRDPVGFGSPT